VDDTPNLGLPYIMAAQSQKHVTHNEAIRALDAMVQLAVLDRDLSAPPGSPAEGARYIVGGSPTGAWSGHAGKIAAYQDGAWMLYPPVEGWIAWIADEDVAVVWDGTAWTALTTGGGGGGGSGSFATLGINATADTTNRLTLAADATLLNHNGDGHQLKINKASASDTASLLYQDAFSGRAELGLAGDDDFHFKVSPDGSSWKEAIVIDRSTGVVALPFTSLAGGRDVLTANRTYYVRTDGSDSNTGLVNSSGGAFLTLQKAYDVITRALDLAGYKVTIQVGDGAYTGNLTISQPWTGGGEVWVQGNSGTPANVHVSVASLDAFFATCVLPGFLVIKDLKFSTTTSGFGIHHSGIGTIRVANVVCGACGYGHFSADLGGFIDVTDPSTAAGGATTYSVVGAGLWHLFSTFGSIIRDNGNTCTVTGTQAYGVAYAHASGGRIVATTTIDISGATVTGKRFIVDDDGAIGGTGGANKFPGNVAGTGGTTAGGGVYA
jgi:hypothetical protein